jgi:O-Antigen ligase
VNGSPSIAAIRPRPIALPRFLEQECLETLGFWSLLVLVFALPYELTQRPIVETRVLVLTDLKIVFYAAAAAATLTLVRPALAVMRGARVEASRTLRLQRVAILAFAGLVAAALVSSVWASDRGAALKWTSDLIPGALLWLAMPLWLSHGFRIKLGRVGLSFLCGATVAAAVGVAEVLLGRGLDQHLLWLKASPTVVGPYLRLSGTFEYANIAGGYFELALPIAIAATCWYVIRRHVSWPAVLLGGLCSLLLLAALVLTFSRGAAIGTVGAILAFAAAIRGRPAVRTALRKRWRAICAAVATAAIATAAVVVLSPEAGLRLFTQSDSRWYQMAIRAAPVPSMHTGQLTKVRVSVRNDTPLTWTSTPAQPYNVSYHWLSQAGAVVEFEGARTPLDSPLSPGASRTVSALLRAPTSPGKYTLVWDVVQEGVTWFGWRTGAYLGLAVAVSGPKLAALPDSPPLIPGTSSSGYLPTAPLQPPRSVLWGAALRMFAANPLLGLGPDGFRLNYGQYSRPKQVVWDQRIFANSLPLEMLADLGLVGAIAFFSFLAAAFWPVARLLTRGRASVWEAVAVSMAVAILVHGLVDYEFGSHVIFILFWLICGLAGASALRRSHPLEPA